MKQILCVLLAACVFFGCSKDKEETPVGGIAGSVSDKTTGEPVATVSVSLAPGGKSTVTGSDGTFSFTSLDPGAYSVNISKEGYNPNKTSVSVKAGEQTTAHLLIERIPAIITADRTTLDFGANAGLNTLSFNIVNSSYENLDWSIEENCGWITEVKPFKGTLQYGKTEAIVVVIDRNELEEGENEAVIVVRSSSNGSSEVKVKAVGAAQILPTLNTLDATDISTSSAILNGEITNAGNPAYTERGFVYHTESKPSLENTLGQLTAPVTEEAKYSCRVEGLSFGEKYYVRAYAKNKNGVIYSSNEISFTAQALLPQVSVQEATDINVSAGTAMLHGIVINTGDPAYTERGFVYGTVNNPTVKATKVIVSGKGTGAYSASIADLALDKTYYVRAYAVSEAGIVYSSSEISFATSSTLPEVFVQEATDINVSTGSAMLHGIVINTGDPAYTERGFVYGTVSNPTVEATKVIVAGKDAGAYSAFISDLSLNQTYYVRAYAINEVGVVYSSVEISFTTETTKPVLSIQNATEVNVSSGSAMLHGTIVNAGEPVYSERGFVYGTVNNPSVEDTKVVVSGSGIGAYSALISELSFNQVYYVRAYAVCKTDIVYSNEIQVSMLPVLPQISIQNATNVSVSTGSAVLHGSVISIGDPAYSERGFVYGTITNPTVEDKKVIVTGNGIGAYSIPISGLAFNNMYYVRAYAICKTGIIYSSTEIQVSMIPILPEVSVQNVTAIDVAAGTAILHGTISNAGDPVYTERGFVYGMIDNPTIRDMQIMVTGTEVGSFNASISDLSLNQTYYVRAYAKSATGYVYSSQSTSFNLKPSLPIVSISTPNVNISDGKATLRGQIGNSGIPVYRERGFVYSVDNGTPDINNSLDIKIVVDGTGNGSFSIVETLPLDKTIYVRAYAINEAGIAYSSICQTSTQAILPQIETLEITDANIQAGTATLKGTIEFAGDPVYTERGFVYSTMHNPSIYDNKAIVDGTGITGSFMTKWTNLPTTMYYVRAYAMNRGGVVYGAEQRVDQGWIELPNLGIAVQSKDIGSGTIKYIYDQCENSTLGGYSDWRIPSVNELVSMHPYRDEIGSFVNEYYWTSSIYQEQNIYTGIVTNYFTYMNLFAETKYYKTKSGIEIYRGRCVRTLDQ